MLEERLAENEKKVEALQSEKEELLQKVAEKRNKSEEKSQKGRENLVRSELAPYSSVNLQTKKSIAGSSNRISRMVSKKSIRHSDSQ